MPATFEKVLKRVGMQIITIEDKDFSELLEAFQSAELIGRYWRNNQVQFVKINNRFVLVSQGEDPEKIALKPVRSQFEAEQVAKRLLDREEEQGHSVTRAGE